MYIFLSLFFFAPILSSENKEFNPLDEDANIDPQYTNNGLSSFEDSIIQKLILLGAFYNKQATFLAVAFGVVIAIFFPQKTKSFINSSASCIVSYVAKIRQKFSFFSKKYAIANAYNPSSASSIRSNKLL